MVMDTAEERRGDVAIGTRGRIGVLRLCRPPHNFFDADLILDLARAARDLAADCDVLVLHAEGRNFCAGADLTRRETSAYSREGGHLYDHAVELFAIPVPIVAAVQGKAVGGGLGLALAADLRVGNERSTFHANFARIGIHPGFAVSLTLPALVGPAVARDMLMTARPVAGRDALAVGLLNRFTGDEDPLAAALAVAEEITQAPAAAIASVRQTLGAPVQAALAAAISHERAEQDRLLAATYPEV
jgi:2-(1,2-epoxy-1,2-dihydrophenyl)acetyl-CoA isomerase